MTELLDYSNLPRRFQPGRLRLMLIFLVISLLLMIVTLVLLIRFSCSAATSPDTTASMQQVLATALDLYKLRHGTPPDLARYPAADQLWRIRGDGGQGVEQSPDPFWPYLSEAMTNPRNGRSDILVCYGPVPAHPVASQPAGWLYYLDSGRIIATGASALRPYDHYPEVIRRQLKAHYEGRGIIEGTLHIAFSRDSDDPIWLLAIPFGPPVLLNVWALVFVYGRLRRSASIRFAVLQPQKP